MAMQTPIVGASVKGIKELITDGQTGILTNTDPESIASAIIKFRDPSLRKRLGKNARNYAVKNYDIEKLLNSEIKLLKKFVK